MMDVSEVAAGAGRRAAGRDVPAPRRHSQQMLDIAVRTAAFIILLAGCLIVLVPLLWMLSTSLKTDPEIFANPPQWIPAPAILNHFAHVFQEAPLAIWTRNTALITVTTVVGATMSSSIVGYGFACLRGRGGSEFFYVCCPRLCCRESSSCCPSS